MEAIHPLFQPTVIAVHMLNVIRAGHSLALTIAHYLMSHALHFTETGIHARAIATQHRIRRNKGLQDRDNCFGIHLYQLKICMVASTGLHHHHRDVIGPGSPGSPFTSSTPSQTR